MYFSQSFIVLVSASLLQLAIASPLQIRDSNEGVYLSNCDEFEPGKLFSQMDYYSNAKGGSQNSEKPDATAPVGDSSGVVTWEGQQVCGSFTSGNTFCSSIVGNGGSLATGDYAGDAYNDQTGFSCYKDSGRTLYTVTGVACKSVYYCYDS